MKTEKLNIPDVFVVHPEIFGDERGGFAELFKASDYASYTDDLVFTQVNYSRSAKDVLRGLHYQLTPKAQGKLVSVVKGTVFDVVVDLRADSPPFKQWLSYEITAESKDHLFVPKGFAHGFLVLSDEAEVHYYCTDEYAPDMERGITWNDPELAISWPVDEPILSGKDQQYPTLAEAEFNF